MLNINKTAEGSALTIALEGRLDTTTAPELEGSWKDASSGVTELTIDLKALDYIHAEGHEQAGQDACHQRLRGRDGSLRSDRLLRYSHDRIRIQRSLY